MIMKKMHLIICLIILFLFPSSITIATVSSRAPDDQSLYPLETQKRPEPEPIILPPPENPPQLPVTNDNDSEGKETEKDEEATKSEKD